MLRRLLWELERPYLAHNLRFMEKYYLLRRHLVRAHCVTVVYDKSSDILIPHAPLLIAVLV